jgi:uncharacterized protein (UPF0210 family)
VVAAPFDTAARFVSEARQAFQTVGLEVQTTRVAGPDLGSTWDPRDGDRFAAWAADTEAAARGVGIEYLSLGRLPAAAHSLVAEYVAPVLAAGEIGFLSADLVEGDGRIASVNMAGACARAVKQLSKSTSLGFGNLRFAATASCPPNIPFLPAAYHAGGPPVFSIAVEAADVVVQALSADGGMSELEDGMVRALEYACLPVERVADELSTQYGYTFGGIDLSPAPYPTQEISIGGAIERGGVERFGAPGTLYMAAMITRAIRRTRVQRCGFSGLMLPVLEDSILARRTSECPATLHELLLYSAVCGTGLDTIPLPDEVSEAELAGAYLDVAALSLALGGKPLTARLLPVPGARAGDLTTFTFEYFANTRVPPIAGAGAAGVLTRGA